MKTKAKSTFLLFLTAIIWGFAFVAQRVGAEFVGAFTFNGIRFLLGSLSLIPVILLFEREKIDKSKFLKTLVPSLLAGTILFVASTLQQLGVEWTGSAGKAGFLTGLYIVLVPIIRFFMGKKTSVFTFFGAIFALVGLFFLCMTGDELSFGKGDVVLIIGALFWAAHILVVDKYVNTTSPLKFSLVQFLICGFLSIFFAYKKNISSRLKLFDKEINSFFDEKEEAITMQINDVLHINKENLEKSLKKIFDEIIQKLKELN